MAAVPITLVGISTDDTGQTKNVTFVGMASITGFGVGGGPIMPPEKPGIWPEPRPPHPAHPIVLPPGGERPPIDPPVEPPTNPPSASWEWGWSPQYGWHPVFVAGDKPQPVPPPV